MTFHERKNRRRRDFYKYSYGWKLKNCVACNGSGYYDDNGSPPCESCCGTGKDLVPGEKQINYRENGL